MFRAVATIPTDCKGDKLCEMSKNVTKDEKTTRTLTIEGQITLTGAELKGTYEGHWSLGTNIKIEKIQLILRIGTDTKIFFAVTVAIVKPALELEGNSRKMSLFSMYPHYLRVGSANDVRLGLRQLLRAPKPFWPLCGPSEVFNRHVSCNI